MQSGFGHVAMPSSRFQSLHFGGLTRRSNTSRYCDHHFCSIYSAKGWFHPFLNTSCGVWSIEGQQFSSGREPITKSRNDRVFVTESVVINLRMSAVHLKHEKPCRLLVEHTRILLKSIDHTTEEKTKERLEKTLFFSHFDLGSRVL